MAHIHRIYDTDRHFIVDPITRNIISENGKVTIMQYDHNSERFTFEVPRFVEGHDMSLTDKIEIHYVNSAGQNKSEDIYEVDDRSLSPDSEDMVIFSWLIGETATKYAGTLAFSLRFVCFDETEITYQWFSATYNGIKVISAIYNTLVVTGNGNPDILEKWKAEILAELGNGDLSNSESLKEILKEYLKNSNGDGVVTVGYPTDAGELCIRNTKGYNQGGAYMMTFHSPVDGRTMVHCRGVDNAKLGSYGFGAVDKFVIWDVAGVQHEVVHTGNLEVTLESILARIAALEEGGVSGDIPSVEGVEF